MVNYSGREWSLWYFAETTEGTARPLQQYKALAQHSELRFTESPNPVIVGLSGSVDNSTISKGVSNITLSVQFVPSGANGAQFIEDFASSDTSFTLIAKAGTIFQTFAGCKIKSVSASCKTYPDHGPLEVTAEIWAWTLSSSEPATVTYETIPSSVVNYSDVTLKLDAGATASTTLTDWWETSFSIDNDLYRLRSNTGATTAIHRGIRKADISITRPITDSTTTEVAAATAATAYSASIAFASSTYTFTSGAFTDVEVSHPRTEMSGKRINLIASTLTIT